MVRGRAMQTTLSFRNLPSKKELQTVASQAERGNVRRKVEGEVSTVDMRRLERSPRTVLENFLRCNVRVACTNKHPKF